MIQEILHPLRMHGKGRNMMKMPFAHRTCIPRGATPSEHIHAKGCQHDESMRHPPRPCKCQALVAMHPPRQCMNAPLLCGCICMTCDMGKHTHTVSLQTAQTGGIGTDGCHRAGITKHGWRSIHPPHMHTRRFNVIGTPVPTTHVYQEVQHAWRACHHCHTCITGLAHLNPPHHIPGDAQQPAPVWHISCWSLA